jgi:hypothetical protein
MKLNLLTVDSPKTRKGESMGILTGILYMAPSDESGYNVCPMAMRQSGESADAVGVKSRCSESCLTFAGKGNMPAVRAARVRRTKLYFEDRSAFRAMIWSDIEALRMRVVREGWDGLVIRLDGTSDLGLAAHFAPMFPSVQFVDYTKVIKRARAQAYDPEHPKNWNITFSASEVTSEYLMRGLLDDGINVSMVFAGKDLPESYMGWRVIDGDVTDLRHLDPVGVIVGLRMKGVSNAFKAAGAASGFARVIPLAVA